MKRRATHTLTLLVGVTIGFMLSGCAATRMKQVSGVEFLNRAKDMEVPCSISWITYIGKSHSRAYLELGYPAFVGRGTRTTVLWTPLSELPNDIVQKLEAGRPPWKEWTPETTKAERTIEFTVPK